MRDLAILVSAAAIFAVFIVMLGFAIRLVQANRRDPRFTKLEVAFRGLGAAFQEMTPAVRRTSGAMQDLGRALEHVGRHRQ